MILIREVPSSYVISIAVWVEKIVLTSFSTIEPIIFIKTIYLHKNKIIGLSTNRVGYFGPLKNPQKCPSGYPNPSIRYPKEVQSYHG